MKVLLYRSGSLPGCMEWICSMPMPLTADTAQATDSLMLAVARGTWTMYVASGKSFAMGQYDGPMVVPPMSW